MREQRVVSPIDDATMLGFPRILSLRDREFLAGLGTATRWDATDDFAVASYAANISHMNISPPIDVPTHLAKPKPNGKRSEMDGLQILW